MDRRHVTAWAVHLFTSSGAVIALFALRAAADADARQCFLWLSLGLVVDGVDGTLARRADVARVLPGVNGAVLDLLVDFLTYVFVPAFLMERLGVFPAPLALQLAAFAVVTSLYCFCNAHMKSHDYYFSGFPATWNVVALYMWLLRWPPPVNAVITVALGVLTFIPAKFLHPLRVRALRGLNVAVCGAGMVCCLALIWLYPASPSALVAVWLLATAYYLAVCAWRSLQDVMPARPGLTTAR